MRKGFTLIELMIVIAIIAIIAAIAIPNLLESRVTANEAASSSSLKSGVYPAQVQFQAGGYQDLDADNVGEYGTLRALAGLDATNKIIAGSIRLLTGPLAISAGWSAATGVGAPALGTASGYSYAAYCASQVTPPAPGGVSDTAATVWYEGQAAPGATGGDTLAAGNTANNGERYWVAACAPERFGDSGRRPFCISEDGQVRSPATAAGVATFYLSTVNMVPKVDGAGAPVMDGPVDPATGNPTQGTMADPTQQVTVANGKAIDAAAFSRGVSAIYGQTGLMTTTFASWTAGKSFPVYSK
jgi:prepilin-type N-terminal cleavage/methylation domain-containing protein